MSTMNEVRFSFNELYSSLEEFKDTLIYDMTLGFFVGWCRSLANIISFMTHLPEVHTEMTLKELQDYVEKELEKVNESQDSGRAVE